MRRNLELAEQLCVTLAEELDFVKTYIDLERRSLGATFHPVIEIAGDVLARAGLATFHDDTDSGGKFRETRIAWQGRKAESVDCRRSSGRRCLHQDYG